MDAKQMQQQDTVTKKVIINSEEYTFIVAPQYYNDEDGPDFTGSFEGTIIYPKGTKEEFEFIPDGHPTWEIIPEGLDPVLVNEIAKIAAAIRSGKLANLEKIDHSNLHRSFTCNGKAYTMFALPKDRYPGVPESATIYAGILSSPGEKDIPVLLGYDTADNYLAVPVGTNQEIIDNLDKIILELKHKDLHSSGQSN